MPKPKTPKTPTLIPLDMSLSSEHDHPQIKAGQKYLCLINNQYFAGEFNKHWYGWHFDGWHYGLQFDAPGTNASQWQAIWEIKTSR